MNPSTPLPRVPGVPRGYSFLDLVSKLSLGTPLGEAPLRLVRTMKKQSFENRFVPKQELGNELQEKVPVDELVRVALVYAVTALRFCGGERD